MDAARLSRDFFPSYFRMILLYFLPLCAYAWPDIIFRLLAGESLHFPKTSSLLTYAYLCTYVYIWALLLHTLLFSFTSRLNCLQISWSLQYSTDNLANMGISIQFSTFFYMKELYPKTCQKNPKKIYIYRYKMSNGFKKYLTIKRLTYTRTHTYSVKPKLQQKCCKWWAILKLSSIKYLTRKCTFFVPSNI